MAGEDQDPTVGLEINGRFDERTGRFMLEVLVGKAINYVDDDWIGTDVVVIFSEPASEKLRALALALETEPENERDLFRTVSLESGEMLAFAAKIIAHLTLVNLLENSVETRLESAIAREGLIGLQRQIRALRITHLKTLRAIMEDGRRKHQFNRLVGDADEKTGEDPGKADDLPPPDA